MSNLITSIADIPAPQYQNTILPLYEDPIPEGLIGFLGYTTIILSVVAGIMLVCFIVWLIIRHSQKQKNPSSLSKTAKADNEHQNKVIHNMLYGMGTVATLTFILGNLCTHLTNISWIYEEYIPLIASLLVLPIVLVVVSLIFKCLHKTKVAKIMLFVAMSFSLVAAPYITVLLS